MNITSRYIIITAVFIAAYICGISVPTEAGIRAVYLGPDNMDVTGRTMDWKEDPQSNIYFFPRGMVHRGGIPDNTVKWISAYGSLVTAGYNI